MHRHPHLRRIVRAPAFTLIELILVIAIIGVIAAIVIVAINPNKQLSRAQDIRVQSEANQLEKALSQFVIDKGKPPDSTAKYDSPTGKPMPICSPDATDKTVCVDLSPLVTTYIAALPVYPKEPCPGVTGYATYRDKMGPHIIPQPDKDASTCPVSIVWDSFDPTKGTIGGGMLTLADTLDLTGKSLTIGNGGSLNLNGKNVIGNAVTNNGTIVALGGETVSTNGSAGAWKIIGNGDLSALNGKTGITNLTLAPTVTGTVFKPTTALNVGGTLTVGDTAILDTTGANSAFSAVANNGVIIMGDNAVTFGSYDSANGQTVITGTVIPSGLSFHDLTIASNTTLSDTSHPATVNGTLTVNSGKQLLLGAGTSLLANGNVSVQGTLTGQGTMTIGGANSALILAAGGSLSGTDSTHLLVLNALKSWILANYGSVSNLGLQNAQAATPITCNGCKDNGGNTNITFPVTNVAVVAGGGGGATYILRKNGTVWAWGYNGNGQLGDGTTTQRKTPVQVVGALGVGTLSNITNVSGGYNHAVALGSNGTVWTWGMNTNGQLGNGTNADSTYPVQASGITDAIAVAGAVYGNHTLVLRSNGTVMAFGSNSNGQLGNGSTVDSNVPVPVTGLTGIVAIAAGRWHSVALRNDGAVFAWGVNTNGQLGDGTTTQRTTPVRVTDSTGAGNLTGITAISAGAYHSVALQSGGYVWSWGLNNNGQLGNNTFNQSLLPVEALNASGVGFLSGITAIVAGADHDVALKGSAVWVWGYGWWGQLGNGSGLDVKLPVQPNVSTATAIGAGVTHTILVQSDGNVYDFGNNNTGALGNNTTTSSNVPVHVLGQGGSGFFSAN